MDLARDSGVLAASSSISSSSDSGTPNDMNLVIFIDFFDRGNKKLDIIFLKRYIR